MGATSARNLWVVGMLWALPTLTWAADEALLPLIPQWVVRPFDAPPFPDRIPDPTGWPTMAQWRTEQAPKAPWQISEIWYAAELPASEAGARALALDCRHIDAMVTFAGKRLPGGCGADAVDPKGRGRQVFVVPLPPRAAGRLVVRARRSAALTVNLRRFSHWSEIDGVVGPSEAVAWWAEARRTAISGQALLRLGLGTGFALVGFFHLAVWARRRSLPAWGWFGVGALAAAAFDLEGGGAMLPPPWSIPASYTVRHPMLWGFTGLTSMCAFAWYFTQERPPVRAVRWVLGMGLLMAFTQVVPWSFPTHLALLDLEGALAVAMVAAGLLILLDGVLRRRPQALLLLAAGLTASVPTTLGITGAWAGLPIGALVVPGASVGFLVATAGMAAMLSSRFTHTLEVVDRRNAELEATNQAIQRFVPRDFLALLERRSIVDVHLGDRSARRMAILFADLRGFTTLSEQLDPDQTFDLVNAFFARMAEPIEAAGGFIDKYIGDEIMALFPGDARRSPSAQAVQAALGMQAALDALRRDTDQAHVQALWLGVGVHAGRVVLGVVGAEQRLDGTVISDTVNIAARVEALTRTYEAPILITGDVADDLPAGPHALREVGEVVVRGRQAATRLFEVTPA